MTFVVSFLTECYEPNGLLWQHLVLGLGPPDFLANQFHNSFLICYRTRRKQSSHFDHCSFDFWVLLNSSFCPRCWHFETFPDRGPPYLCMDFFIVVLFVDYHPNVFGFPFGPVRRVQPSSAPFVRATDEANFIPLDEWFLLFSSSRHDNNKKYEISRPTSVAQSANRDNAAESCFAKFKM
jgi:hypothetical protein